MKVTPKEVGQRIKKIRKERHWTQEELAKKIIIARPCIAYYENGDRYPTVPTLIRLCEALDVSSDWLLGLGGKGE
jgi:transcriptional regulator with XRE-family HTH domain